jgi:hypothetical protein
MVGIIRLGSQEAGMPGSWDAGKPGSYEALKPRSIRASINISFIAFLAFQPHSHLSS